MVARLAARPVEDTIMSASDDTPDLGALGARVASQALQALPPEVKELLQPGKQSDRVNRAIRWAARRDPEVLRLHRQHGSRNVQTLEDVRNVPLAKMDHVARHIAKRYRRYAAFTGSLTGLPGGLWAVAAAGADVQLTAIYAVRMASGIAQAYGYDTSVPEELSHLAEVLALVAGVDSLRGVGNWISREGLQHLLPEILPKLVARLGAQLTKEQASRAVGRLIPGVGAVVGGAIDYTFLRVAGDKVMDYYHHRYLVDHGLAPAETVEPGHAIAAMAPGAGRAVAAAPAGADVPAIAAPHKRERPPERFGVYLAIFAMIALVITIAACAALVILAAGGIQTLLHSAH
jgi:hypothetical protein